MEPVREGGDTRPDGPLEIEPLEFFRKTSWCLPLLKAGWSSYATAESTITCSADGVHEEGRRARASWAMETLWIQSEYLVSILFQASVVPDEWQAGG